MAKYKKKPVVIEAITFDELTSYGKEKLMEFGISSPPYSFEFKGCFITRQNEECCIIPTREGVMKMTPNDMLITGVNGEIYPCKIDIFKKTYEQVSYSRETGEIPTSEKTINSRTFEYRDCIFNRTKIKLSFWDRIKVLFGKEIFSDVDIYVMNEEAEVVFTDSRVSVPKIFKKKPSKLAYVHPLNDSKPE